MMEFVETSSAKTNNIDVMLLDDELGIGSRMFPVPVITHCTPK
jgi:hypothetical protein